MPLYGFVCFECDTERECMSTIDERNEVRIICKCGTRMKRKVEAPALGKSRYQMQAVMTDGTHIKGHFGKEAPLLKKKKE